MKPFLLLLCLLPFVASHGIERSFQVTFRVVDDEGRPVVGAKTEVSYENAKATKPSERIRSSEGMSNDEGQVTLEGKTFASGISYGASKAEYYSAYGLRYHFKDSGFIQWQPWNPTIQVLLRRIKNPVPMYAKRVEVKIPEFSKPMGYDLVQGDWVVPYGNGQMPDLIFEADRNVQNDQEYHGKLTLRFSNEGDGLLDHEVANPDLPGLRMPYFAPDEGYLATKTWQESRHTSANGDVKVISSASRRMNYFIRVRTVRDKEGKIISALYGKIHGDFRWFIGARAPKSGLAFTYYLNPDGTRNIEYDPKRNLLNPTNKDDSTLTSLEP